MFQQDTIDLEIHNMLSEIDMSSIFTTKLIYNASGNRINRHNSNKFLMYIVIGIRITQMQWDI